MPDGLADCSDDWVGDCSDDWVDGRAAVLPGRFAAAVTELGSPVEVETLLAEAEAVAARWSEPGRYYHDREHLGEVLIGLDLLGNTDPAVELAAWFHDVVYTGGHTPAYKGAPGDDERASAAAAASTLARLGVGRSDCARVADLVLVTIDHRASSSSASRLCDADLRILSAPAARYDRYAAAVRQEYAAVPTATFNAVRADLLAGLLARTGTRPGPAGPLFRTMTARAWTARAAVNLRTEIERLRR